ncbi:MAG: tetratricopeptide repeat protein [Pseudomonadota bacterium]
MSQSEEHATAADQFSNELYSEDVAATAADDTGTEDLKSILKLIAAQLQDVDRRQTEVLSQMQHRLEDLEGQTKARKARVPAAFVPAFERIQDGIHQLVQQISDDRETSPSDTASHSAAPSADTTSGLDAASGTDGMAMFEQDDNQPSGFGEIAQISDPITEDPSAFNEEPMATSEVGSFPSLSEAEPFTETPALQFDQSSEVAANETIPLRSALNEDSFQDEHFKQANTASNEQTSHPTDVDTFDMVEANLGPAAQAPSTEEQLWDQDSAEALTQVYENDVLEFNEQAGNASGLPAFSNETPHMAEISQPDSETTETPIGFVSETTSVTAPASYDAGPAVDFDREWLQERFSEIAERVEQSLATARPDEQLFAISDRMEQMQGEITEVLRDVATRSDIDAMKSEEFPVEELLSHLDRTDAKLDQIASVDDKLAVVIAQLSDERFNALISEVAPSVPVSMETPEVDFDRVASVAAEAVAVRFAEMGEQAGEQPPAIDEMRELLEKFIEGQRKDHEETAGTLDTIQHAMVNILDRVEAMEMSGTAAAYAAPDAGLPETQGFADVEVAASAVQQNVGSEPSPTIESEPVTTSVLDDDYARPQYNTEEPTNETSGVIAPELEPMNAIDRIRQDFIDDARRAKANAAAMAEANELAEEAKQGAKPARKSILGSLTGGLSKDANSHSAGVEAVLSGSSPDEAGADSKIFGIRRNTVMIGAFVTLIAVTSALMLMRKDRFVSATPSEPAIERSVGAPAGQTPTAPGRDSLDQSNANGHTAPVGNTTSVASLDNVPGIKIQPAKRQLNAIELAKIEERRSMAELSSQLGTDAANASPASVMKEFGVGAESGLAQSAVQRVGMASKLDLPPATVGPLSLRLSAAKGDPSAQFEVGARLAEGKGTKQNFSEAIGWYTRSANQGFAQSMYRLGTMYERGLGVDQHHVKAANYYEQAADRGNIKAMHNLAVLKAGSSTTSPDYLSAAHWFAKAADYGLADSQYNLAVLFENGLGVKKDMVEAYKFFTLSAKSGDPESVKRRDEARAKLTSLESLEAEKLIKNWRPKRPDRIANDARAAGEEWKKRANGQYSS